VLCVQILGYNVFHVHEVNAKCNLGEHFENNLFIQIFLLFLQISFQVTLLAELLNKDDVLITTTDILDLYCIRVCQSLRNMVGSIDILQNLTIRSFSINNHHENHLVRIIFWMCPDHLRNIIFFYRSDTVFFFYNILSVHLYRLIFFPRIVYQHPHLFFVSIENNYIIKF